MKDAGENIGSPVAPMGADLEQSEVVAGGATTDQSSAAAEIVNDVPMGSEPAPVNDGLTNPEQMGGMPKKKSKLPLILTLAVIAVLLIGGGVFAAVWAVSHNSPENTVINGIVKSLGQKAAKVSGDLTLTGDGLENSGLKSITLKASGESEIVPSSVEMTLTVETTADESYAVKVSEVVMEGGVFYFKIDGLMDLYENALPEEVADELYGFEGIIEEVDGTWWKFDINEFTNDDTILDQYDCMIDAAKSISDKENSKELGDLYRAYPVLDVKKLDGVKDGDADGYEVTLNSENTAEFVNNMRDTKFFKKVLSCVEASAGSEVTMEDVTADDFEVVAEDGPQVVMFVTPWSHDLTGMQIKYSDDNFSFAGKLNWEYVDSVNVTAPEGAKPVMDLVRSIIVEVCEMTYANSYYYDYDVDCEEMADQAMDSLGGSGNVGVDTQREDDLSRFLTAIVDYQANNSGMLPFECSGGVCSENATFVQRYIDDTCTNGPSSAAGFDCDEDMFRDPTGTVYEFAQAKVGDDDTAQISSTSADGKIYYAVGYSCGATSGALVSGSSRTIALLMVSGDGAITCAANS